MTDSADTGEKKKERVFSGIQPTGTLHIGNYLGAIQNWVTLLDEYECIFCIVDYHAITVPYEPDEMQERVRQAVMLNMAAGLDPERCTLFVQSHVPQHTELCWILTTCAAWGHLNRMTQFKEKSEQHKEFVSAGLFAYPVLMAADILLYKASQVPVGEDQTQHLEFSREVCRRFNARFGDTFPEPEPIYSDVPRLMGLESKNKMSKSLNNYISLLDDPDTIKEKLKRAAHDPARVRRDDPGTPEICNIFTMHQGFSSPEEIEWAAEGCRTAGIGCIDCKKCLTKNMIATLEPIRQRYQELEANPDKVNDIIRQGDKFCSEQAEKTMAEVRRRMGLR